MIASTSLYMGYEHPEIWRGYGHVIHFDCASSVRSSITSRCSVKMAEQCLSPWEESDADIIANFYACLSVMVFETTGPMITYNQRRIVSWEF